MLTPGVFVGTMSGLVRDKLWELAQEKACGGAGLLIHSARTEQGFRVRAFGDPSRQPIDMEGLMLIRIPERRAASGTPGRTARKRKEEPMAPTAESEDDSPRSEDGHP